MTRPSATCELFVDGTRIADRGYEFAAGAATALSSLKLAWGRDGQNEQPGPASCNFEILDPAGGDNALDYLHVGSAVAVWADGEIENEAGGYGPNTYDDGSFNTKVNGPVPPLDVEEYSGATGEYENGTIKIISPNPYDVSYGAGMYVPPRAFSPAGQLPNAWDDIPRANVGETWQISVRARAPIGVQYSVRATFYDSPYAGSPGHSASWRQSPLGNLTGTGDWQTYVGSITAVTLGGGPSWLALNLFFRSDPYGQARWSNQPAARSWNVAPSSWDSWANYGTDLYGDDVAVQPPPLTHRRVLTFSGQVSDVSMEPFGDGQTVLVKATAMDLGAQLANRVIGDNPWAVQTLATRADRIAELAGVTSAPRVRVDAALSALPVSYRDVDAQGAYPLLQDLAQTGGGVLWAATHAVTGPFLWIEDPGSRVALKTFTFGGGQIFISATGRDVTNISACDLLEDGAAWHQDSADVITVVGVTWLEQGTDDDGQPTTTERTETVTDTAALATYGTRRLSVSTELISQTDAANTAARLLMQARSVAWRLAGLTLDTATMPDTNGAISDQARVVGLLDLLDGTTRMGLAVLLIDMPAYAPLGATSAYYLEGGAYEFVDGYWRLALATAPSGSQGATATWNEFKLEKPTWLWNQWAPAIVWQDTFGVTIT